MSGTVSLSLQVGVRLEPQDFEDASHKIIKEGIRDWWKSGVFKSRSGDEGKVLCHNGHPLVDKGQSLNSWWRCDSRQDCDTENVQRFRCDRCDYDLCGSCYKREQKVVSRAL
jgi:hypothetical protein